MVTRPKLLLFLLCAGLPIAFPARAQILNGSFETPVISNLNVLGIGLLPGVGLYTSLINPTGISDWTVGAGDVTLVDAGGTLASSLGLFTAYSGNQYVVLNGLAENVTAVPLGVTISQTGTVGTLAQTFTTTPGQTYQISFAYRGLAVGALTNNPIVDIGLTNATSSTAPANGTLTANISLNAWQTDTFSFVATGSSSTLSFYQDASGVSAGLIGLDAVALTPLPEPSQYGAAAVTFLTVLIGVREWRRRSPVPAVPPSVS